METLEVKQTSEIAVIETKIDLGLLAFEERKAQLAELKSEADGLKIESIDDKETISQVSTVRKKLKSARVDISKEGKAMRDPLTAISRMISDKEKELIDIIEPTEQQLQQQEKWVQDEKERIQKRIYGLARYGFQIDYADIKQMSEETFGKYLEAAKSQFEKAELEKAESERIRKEQQEQDRINREAEQNRIKAEREELEVLRRQSAEIEERIRSEQESIETEKRKIEEEKARIARDKELQEVKIKAAEDARLKAIEDAKIEAERKKEAERKAKEAADRKAARQPDRVKITAYIEAIMSIPAPEMKTPEGKEVLEIIQHNISLFSKQLDSLL